MEVHGDVGPFRPAIGDKPLFDSRVFIDEWGWNRGLIVFPQKG